MKRTILFAMLAATGLAAFAQPAGQPFMDRARVQSVEPQFETVQIPRQECGSQWVTTEARPNGSLGGAVAGAVIGGILGHQVGGGSGKDAATAAGVIIGAGVGNHMGSRDQPVVQEQREVRNCRTVYEMQQRPAGYRVTYEYRNQVYTTVMREQPGNTLPVRVSVMPVEEREYHRR